jgi:hypothetical protein
VKADELLDLLATPQMAVRVARAVDSRSYREARGWDLTGWTCRREPWGMYFIRHDRRLTPVEAVAVITSDGADADRVGAAVQGVTLPTRFVDLSPGSENGAATVKDGPAGRSGVNRKSLLLQLGLLGVLFVTLAIGTAYSRSRRHESPPRKTGESQRLLYCPECGLEMTCPSEFEHRPINCPHCVKQRMEVTAVSRAGGNAAPSRANWVVVAVAIGLPLALAVALYGAGRVRAGREQGSEANARQVSCPGCGHKMKSGVFGPGATAVCPACAEHFVVPGTGRRQQASAEGTDVRQWREWLGSELKKGAGGRPPGTGPP